MAQKAEFVRANIFQLGESGINKINTPVSEWSNM